MKEYPMVNSIVIPIVAMAIGLIAAVLWSVALPQVWSGYTVAAIVFLTVCVGSALLMHKFRRR